jgi:hypothetical protein
VAAGDVDGRLSAGELGVAALELDRKASAALVGSQGPLPSCVEVYVFEGCRARQGQRRTSGPTMAVRLPGISNAVTVATRCGGEGTPVRYDVYAKRLSLW